jgi:type IV secretion system protein VirD4
MDPHRQPESLYRLPTYTHSAAQGVFLMGLVAAGLDVLVSALLAGSWVARRWGYLPRLGAPWIRLPEYPRPGVLAAAGLATGALLLAGAMARRGRGDGGAGSGRGAGLALLTAVAPVALPCVVGLYLVALAPVYPPLAFTRWSGRYEGFAALAPAIAAGRVVLFGSLAPMLAVTLAATAARLGVLRETGDTHGSSHWATPCEVAATGLMADGPAAADGGPPAVVVGAWHGRAPGQLRSRLHRLADRRDRHVLAFAPSGSGKSTCLVIPTLLTWTSSVVVLDIKGELWHLTAGYRREVLGQACLRLDLSCADGTAAAYNPLLLVPRGPGDVKHAQTVADVLVDPEGKDQPRTFWEQSAHALLTAVILHVLYAEEDKTLAGCARLLSDPARPLPETLEALLSTRHDPGLDRGWIDPHRGRATYTHPVVAAAARSLLDMDPRTSSGIVATAQAHLSLFRDPVLAANTARCDFTPLDLVAGERPVSLYLTLAPADLDRLRGPIRLVLNQLCRALTERLDFEPASSRPAHRHALLLLLDEFAVLGKLDFFGRAMAYLRGYGIRVYLSIQSLAQLHDIYGPHQSITANCPLQVAFAPADLETAELLSRMVGPTTVHLAKRALNDAPLTFGPRRHTLSLHELARPLLTAEEVRRLPDGEALVFVAGHPTVRGRRVAYFADAEWAGRGGMGAPGRSDRVAMDGAGAGAGADADAVEVDGAVAESRVEAGEGSEGGESGEGGLEPAGDRYRKGYIEEPLMAALARIPGLPLPERELEIVEGGRLITVPDFAWEDVKVAVYCDGFAVHGKVERLELDAGKRNWLQARGWAVLTYWGRTILRDADRCAEQIAKVYRSRQAPAAAAERPQLPT